MKQLYLLGLVTLMSKGLNTIQQTLPEYQKQNTIPLVPTAPSPAPVVGQKTPAPSNVPIDRNRILSVETTVQIPVDEFGDQRVGPVEKTKSDAACAQLLKTLAQEVFFEIPAKLQSKSNQKVPQLKTAYDAYIFYIKDMLLTLQSNPDFKKKGALRSLVSANGQLDNFFKNEMPTTKIEQEAFIQTVYDELAEGKSHLLSQFSRTMAPLFFSPTLEPNVRDSLEDILINVIVSGRKKYDLTSASRTISDGLVHAALQRVLQPVFQELAQRSPDATASAKLSKEYSRILRRELSRLRVEPQFLKYENLMGAAARARSQAAGNPIQKLALYPVLDLLETTDISLLDRNKLKYAMNGQLVFNDQVLHDIFNQPAAFDALLKDRISRIMEQRGTINIGQFLNEMIPLAQTPSQLKDTLALLAKNAGMKPEIRDLQFEFNKIDIDVQKVVSLFKKLAGTNTLLFEGHIRNVIDTAIKEKETAIKGVEILKAARAEYERTKKYVDGFVLQELKKQQDEAAHPAKFDKPIALFTAIDRTPDAVQRVFSYNIGVGAATDTYAKKADFRKWFHPYGLLLEVLRTAPVTAQEVAAEGPHAQLLVLIDSLHALNTASIANKKYAQALLSHRELVVMGIYKNMLTRMIMLLESRRINEFIQEITQFVKNVGIQLEEKPEFRARMTDLRGFLVDLFLKDTLEMLTHLNNGTGDRPVDGLATDSPGGIGLRNAVVYQNLKGAFKPVLDLIINAQNTQSIRYLSYPDFEKARDAALTAITQTLQKPAVQARFVKTQLPEEQRKEIIASFERYFNRLWTRDSSGLQHGALQSLQAAAALLPEATQKPIESAPTEEEYDGSIPPAPPAPPL